MTNPQTCAAVGVYDNLTYSLSLSMGLLSEELLKQQLTEISEQQAIKTKPVELPKDIDIRYNLRIAADG